MSKNTLFKMDNDDELPKGMHKMPAEFDTEETGVSTTHSDCNYSSIIRKALAELSKDGIDINIKKLELMEDENSPAVVALILEVRVSK